jgi:hypothetical protein
LSCDIEVQGNPDKDILLLLGKFGVRKNGGHPQLALALCNGPIAFNRGNRV